MKKLLCSLCVLLCFSGPAQFAWPGAATKKKQPPVAVGFSANGANFGGIVHLVHSGALSGAADGKQVTISLWLDSEGRDGSSLGLFSVVMNTSARLFVSRNTANKIQVAAYDSSGVNLVDVTSTSTITAASGIVHVLCAIDLDTPETHVWFNGVEETLTTTALFAGTIDLATASPIQYIGNGASKYLGNIWELAYYQAFINDPAKFRDVAGHPKDLGGDGSLPGAQPIIYLSRAGSSTNWVNDSSGRGNNFTQVSSTLSAPTATP